MKKIKLLSTLAITTIPLATITPILTGCSCGSSQPVYTKTKIKSIYVEQQPDQISYAQYDKLNLDGLIIKKIMTDGSVDRLYKNEYTTSIEDGDTLNDAGDISITVLSKKDNKSTSFKINVLERASADFVLIKKEKGYCIDGLNNTKRESITDLVVPEEINGTPVIEISKGAFKGCTNLQTITLPFIGHTADATEVGGLFGYIFGDEMYEGCGGYTWQSYSINDQYGVEPEESVGFAIPGSLKTVTITNCKRIAPGAFSCCSHLQSITFSESNAIEATEIGNFAFYNCISLKTAAIPSTIQTIGRSAFAGCYNMKDITIPETVTRIKPTAFSNCLAAYNVTVPETVQYMGKLVFENFAGLLLCESEARPETWDSEWVSETSTVVFDYKNGGVIYTDKMIVAICGQGDDKFASIISWLNDYDKRSTINVPGEVEHDGQIYPIRQLGAKLFYTNEMVETVNIGENITILGPSCFEGCTKLKTVNFPTTLKTIGTSCFISCDKLCQSTNKPGWTEETKPELWFNQVEEIGTSAFEGILSLAKIDLGTKIQTIGSSAFKNCINLAPLREKDTTKNPLVFPKTIKSIGDYAFYNTCKLIPTDESGAYTKADKGDIIFEANNENEELEIGESAFELVGVRSTSAEYPKTISFCVNFNKAPIKTFSKCAFKNCYTYWLFGFPENVEVIEEQAFYDSIPVYTIENDTTSNKCRLIEIPATVKSIGYRAFYDCYNCGFRILGAKDGTSQLTYIGEQAFRYCSYNPINPGDDKSDGAYKEIYMPDTVTYCGPYAFGSNTGARTVHISTGLTRLEPGMFSSCKNLGYDQTALDESASDVTYHDPVVVPENITYIGYNAFSDCNVLKAVTIEGKITTLGSNAFTNCAALEHGKTMTDRSNKPLHSLIFKDDLESVTSFGTGIYQGCTNLVWAPWQGSGGGTTTPYTSIPAYSFTDCTKLTDFNVLPAVTTIGNSAFRSCSSMQAVTGMSAVKYIYQNAFDGCSGLIDFAMPSGCHTIGDYAFKNCTNLGKTDHTFKLPTDIVKKWTSSSNIGMGTEPFVGWTADQTITFTSSNIDQDATAELKDGKIALKWGWILTPDNVSSPSYYTCNDSGSSTVHFVLGV